MRITSAIDDLPADRVRRILSGLPEAGGYLVHVKPLRYRDRPHLSAWTDFASRFWVFWIRNTMRNVTMVVPVLMISCQVSE